MNQVGTNLEDDMRNLLILFLMTHLLIACGSIKTIGKTDEQVIRSLNKDNGSCSTITRIYSGVGYDLCVLNKGGKSSYHDALLGVYLFDVGASAVLDTVALPYTTYDQYKNGSIAVK
jgi:uncharacterized protein YceK